MTTGQKVCNFSLNNHDTDSNYCFLIALFVVIEIKFDTPNMELPVVALLALADHVKLGILPSSHKLVAFEQDGSECNRLCSAIEFTFKVGEIIVFHPLLVHYGCAYSANEQSLRVHFYFDNDQLVRVAGDGKLRTFFFTLPVQPVSGPPKVKKGQKRNATIGTIYNFAKKRQRTEELEEKSTKNVSTRVSTRVSKRVSKRVSTRVSKRVSTRVSKRVSTKLE